MKKKLPAISRVREQEVIRNQPEPVEEFMPGREVNVLAKHQEVDAESKTPADIPLTQASWRLPIEAERQ